MGQEAKASSQWLSARSRLGERTFVGPHDNGQGAPIPAIGPASIELVKPTHSCTNLIPGTIQSNYSNPNAMVPALRRQSIHRRGAARRPRSP
jgi:hypothetical protein